MSSSRARVRPACSIAAALQDVQTSSDRTAHYSTTSAHCCPNCTRSPVARSNRAPEVIVWSRPCRVTTTPFVECRSSIQTTPSESTPRARWVLETIRSPPTATITLCWSPAGGLGSRPMTTSASSLILRPSLKCSAGPRSTEARGAVSSDSRLGSRAGGGAMGLRPPLRAGDSSEGCW